MSDEARKRLLDRIELAQESDRAENGSWIYVTLDEDGAPVNASGPFPSEADAFLASHHEEVTDTDATEAGWTHKIVPLFAPSA